MNNKFFTQYPPPAGTVVEADQISLDPLQGLTVAIIGYGTMGRAQAMNLHRSGVSVVVGSRPQSKTGERAKNEGLMVYSVAEAAKTGDVVMLMLPDEFVARVFEEDIKPALGPETVIGLAHGFAIAFNQINWPGPCFLAAPKGQGDMLMAAFAEGGGVPGLLAVTENSPPETWDLAAAYAKAVGCLVGGGFVTTFRQECISDQFGEQAVLCGGVIELLQAAFDIMVQGGYGEENAYFECVHELKLITDLLHRHGIDGMRQRISGTASYGGLTRGPRIINDDVKQNMREVLKEIESGEFAGEFLARHDDSLLGIEALKNREAASPLVRAGHRVLPRLHPEKGSSS
jgi:ketol-acid reductoisomerase